MFDGEVAGALGLGLCCASKFERGLEGMITLKMTSKSSEIRSGILEWQFQQSGSDEGNLALSIKGCPKGYPSELPLVAD